MSVLAKDSNCLAWGLALGCLVASLAAHGQAAVGDAAAAGFSAPRLQLVDDALKLHIANGQIAGGIVLVARHGKVALLEAQGVAGVGSKSPLRSDSIFMLASLSKPITAVAVLMLVEEGKIGLDDPVAKYIPEFAGPRTVRRVKPGSPPPPFTPLPFVQPEQAEFGPVQYEMVPATHEMTIRTLLTHTSGIQIFGVPNDFPPPRPGATLASEIPKLARLALEFDPGSRWAYSNGAGFEVLGRVVEVASGQPFDRFLQARLFAPLGMKDTGFGLAETAADRGVAMFPGAPVQLAAKTTYFSGAAGLWSTAGDYSHFVQMLVDQGSYNGHRFLKAGTVAQMSSNQIGPLVMGGYPPMALPPEGLKFGFGVLTVTNPMASGTQVPAGSFGWDGVGSRRWWAIKDEGIVIVMMAPLIGPGAAPLQRDVESAVMRAVIHP
jgi:CubicO group peptidase (beta-lactamase class C family)